MASISNWIRQTWRLWFCFVLIVAMIGLPAQMRSLPVRRSTAKILSPMIRNFPTGWMEYFTSEWFVVYWTAALVVVTAVLAFYTWRLFREAADSSKRIDDREAERLRRAHIAAVAGLPAVLSLITEYTESGYESLRPLWTRIGRNLDGLTYTAPTLDRSLIADIQRAIETVNSEPARMRLADILASLQLVDARLSAIGRDLISRRALVRANLEEYVTDLGSTRALANSLFRFARRETTDIEQYDYAAWRSGIRQLGLSDMHADYMIEAMAIVQRTQDRQGSPYIFVSGVD